MPQERTYKIRAIVLKKTKLSERDLIVTLLDESGAIARCVAKGARKPGGSLAARLDLFNSVECRIAKGRSLDVVTEARLAGSGASAASSDANGRARAPRQFTLEQASCASAIAELVGAVAQEGLEHPRLFAMVEKALEGIAQSPPEGSLALCAACLLKVLALEGVRPRFDMCVVCGNAVSLDDMGASVSISVLDGGVVCDVCRPPSDAMLVDAATLKWAHALIGARFDEILDYNMPVDASFAVLQLVRQWARAHTGKNLKSLDFIFTCGLF